MSIQNYAWSAANNAFYPFSFQADYEAAGSWPSDAVAVDDSVFQEFALGTTPAGETRGVDATTKMPAWISIASTLTLSQAQSQQITVLSAACEAAIYAGFQSSALGNAHTYPAKNTDQMNLTASVLSGIMAIGAPAWVADATHALGDTVTAGGQAYVCTTAGTTGASAPTWPAEINTPVNDGTAAWQIWTTPFWCEDTAGNWDYMPHTAAQIQQVGQDGKAAILANLLKNRTLATQVMTATTVDAVQAIVWS